MHRLVDFALDNKAVIFMLAIALIAAGIYSGQRLPRAILEQRANLLHLTRQFDAADKLRAQALDVPLTAARDN